jgi:triphosphoribosyl-dephospho-CoA synthase
MVTSTAPAFPSTTCPAWGRGWCAALACRLEATARKPGNVHPQAEFADLSHAELVAAGGAIAPVLESAHLQPLGRTILDAVAASRALTRSNANLGIVLAVAPLAAVPNPADLCPERIAAVLEPLGPQDARDIWQAIAIARPGGMGRQERWDLAEAPPPSILTAMRAAAGRDQIARLWTTGYGPLFDGLVRDIVDELQACRPLGDAIVRAYLLQLSRAPDSLVGRKHGDAVAATVSARAADVLAAGPSGWVEAAAGFDRWLRSGGINPGTTADLVAAALYILATTGRLRDLVGHQPGIESIVAGNA